jgi:hypothetical protein
MTIKSIKHAREKHYFTKAQIPRHEKPWPFRLKDYMVSQSHPEDESNPSSSEMLETTYKTIHSVPIQKTTTDTSATTSRHRFPCICGFKSLSCLLNVQLWALTFYHCFIYCFTEQLSTAEGRSCTLESVYFVLSSGKLASRINSFSINNPATPIYVN